MYKNILELSAKSRMCAIPKTTDLLSSKGWCHYMEKKNGGTIQDLKDLKELNKLNSEHDI